MATRSLVPRTPLHWFLEVLLVVYLFTRDYHYPNMCAFGVHVHRFIHFVHFVQASGGIAFWILAGTQPRFYVRFTTTPFTFLWTGSMVVDF